MVVLLVEGFQSLTEPENLILVRERLARFTKKKPS